MTKHPYIGILINRQAYERLRRGKRTGHEKPVFYEEAAMALGHTPCYLKLSALKRGASQGITAGLIRTRNGYASVRIAPPSVIHNRAIYLDRRSIRRLEELSRGGTYIFNLHTRYDKLMLHQLLLQDPVIAPCLPVTEAATPGNVRAFMKQFDALIIKPANGSVGQGIMQLRREDGTAGAWIWKRRSGRRRGWISTRVAAEAGSGRRGVRTGGYGLPMALCRRLRQRRFLVQQFLPLARFCGSPFDIRVSVQRDGTGEWQLTGMVAKVAKRGAFLTNVAQGGRVYPLQFVLESFPAWSPGEVTDRLRELSLHIARYMGERLEGLADLGLDMGILEDGHLVFIEANGRDQRYSFGEAGLMEEWRATYGNPMAYADYLSKRGKTP